MSWMRFAGARPTLTALTSVPRYLMWKLPMYREFFTHREKQWVKTAREETYSPPQGFGAPFRG